MPRARGRVGHGAVFSKHFAAFTLIPSSSSAAAAAQWGGTASADNGAPGKAGSCGEGPSACETVDVVLAAKDGWGVELVAEIASALSLPDAPAGGAEVVPQRAAGAVEVEVLASTTELLEDADDAGATCLHPSELRVRQQQPETRGAAPSGGGKGWRVWRAPSPPPPPPPPSATGDGEEMTALNSAAAAAVDAANSTSSTRVSATNRMTVSAITRTFSAAADDDTTATVTTPAKEHSARRRATAGRQQQQQQPRERGGVGAAHNWRKKKNANRARAFAALLLREFGRDALRAGTGVVDVAGGSGELSFELSTRWGVRSTIVDPRGAGVRITSRHRRLLAQRAANAALLSAEWVAASPLARQLAKKWACFTPTAAGHVKRCFDAALMHDDPAVAALLRGCSAIVGLHPDQATGAIVDAALVLNKPWAVVPCCVFPSAFPERRTPRGGNDASASGGGGGGGGGGDGGERVRTTEQLVQHLAARAPGRARVGTIPCDGANTVVWCAPVQDAGMAETGRQDFPWPCPPPPASLPGDSDHQVGDGEAVEQGGAAA